VGDPAPFQLVGDSSTLGWLGRLDTDDSSTNGADIHCCLGQMEVTQVRHSASFDDVVFVIQTRQGVMERLNE